MKYTCYIISKDTHNKEISSSTYCQASFPLFSLHPSLQTFVFGWHHLVISTKLFVEQWFWKSWPMKTVSSILIKPYCPLEYRMKKMAIWSTYITGSCRGRCWCPVAVASLPLLLPPPPPHNNNKCLFLCHKRVLNIIESSFRADSHIGYQYRSLWNMSITARTALLGPSGCQLVD